MKKVKIKDLQKGDLVIDNRGAFYFEFDKYEKTKSGETVRVFRVGNSCQYFVSEDDTVYIAESLDDLRPSKKVMISVD